MNIMVFNVAAETGGALSILHDVYEDLKKNTSNTYFIVLSKPELSEYENIKILRYPWVKNSWVHRLFFDYFVARTIIKSNNIDEIVSLQNMIVPGTSLKQTLYVHNPFPFVNITISVLKQPILWIYQNALSRIIYRCMLKADKVIVQTNWMKTACLNKLKMKDNGKIVVQQPKINMIINKKFERTRSSYSTFFYPASGVYFKNHKTLIEACRILKEQNITDYNVVISLQGNENKHIVKLYNDSLDHNLPVNFVGNMTRDQVFEYYTKSVLVFPSYIETFGLPLLEAKLHGAPIIASDCPFSHEILYGYENANFFDPFKPQKLADEIRKKIDIGLKMLDNN